MPSKLNWITIILIIQVGFLWSCLIILWSEYQYDTKQSTDLHNLLEVELYFSIVSLATVNSSPPWAVFLGPTFIAGHGFSESDKKITHGNFLCVQMKKKMLAGQKIVGPWAYWNKRDTSPAGIHYNNLNLRGISS